MEYFFAMALALLFIVMVFLGMTGQADLASECAVLVLAMALTIFMPYFGMFVIPFILYVIFSAIAERWADNKKIRITFGRVLPALLALVALALYAFADSSIYSAWPSLVMLCVFVFVSRLVRSDHLWIAFSLFLIAAFILVPLSWSIQFTEYQDAPSPANLTNQTTNPNP